GSPSSGSSRFAQVRAFMTASSNAPSLREWVRSARRTQRGDERIGGTMSTRHSGFLVQSNWGVRGNFEVATPIAAGGLAHLWRNNDGGGLPWSVPYYFGAGFADDVSLLQSSYDSPGNLEVVARYGDRLIHFYRSKDLKWHETVQIASGVTGTPALIESTFG